MLKEHFLWIEIMDRKNDLTQISDQPSDLLHADIPVIASNQLLGNKNIILIQHQTAVYQLRETKAGKLILTKYLS